MGNKLKPIDYLNVLEIVLNDCIYSIDPCDVYEPLDLSFPLHSNSISPEKLVIKKNQYENLSKEAKEMIEAILYSPSEVFDLLATPERGLLSQRSIRKYFRKIWKSKFITDQTIKEIKSWVNQL